MSLLLHIIALFVKKSLWTGDLSPARKIFIERPVTRKKSLVICVTQLAGVLLLKKIKYFEVM